MFALQVALCALLSLNVCLSSNEAEEFNQYKNQAFQTFMQGVETSNVALLQEAEDDGVSPDKAKISVEFGSQMLLLTPLAYAAVKNSERCVFDWLMNPARGVNVNAQDNAAKYTALMLAIKMRHLNWVQWLMEVEGIKPDLKDAEGYTAHAHAAQCPPAAFLIATFTSKLEEEKPFVNTPLQTELFRAIQSDTPSHDASGLVRKALEAGADVNGRMRSYGPTPLAQAIILNCSKKCFDVLSEYAADFNIMTRGLPPLMLALSPIVQSMGSKQVDGNQWAVWMLESQNGGAQLDLTGVAGRAALHTAVAIGQLKVIELLVQKGADPLQADENGSTPWSSAVIKDPPNLDVIRALAGAVEDKKCLDASISAKETNLTAVVFAFLKKNHNLMRALAESGVSLDVPEPIKGFTPLLRALTSNPPDYEMARLLVDLGAKINIPANSGWPAIAYPLCHGRLDDAQYFLDKGASLDVKGANGLSLMNLVLSKNQYQAADWLFAHAPTDKNLMDIMVPIRATAQLTKMTPLAFLIQNGMLSVAKKILERDGGADELSAGFHPLLHVMVADGSTETKIAFYKILAPKCNLPAMEFKHLQCVVQHLSELLTPSQKTDLAAWEEANLSALNRNALNTARAALSTPPQQ